MTDDHQHLQRAIRLAQANVAQGGRPFGAVLTHNGEVLVEAVNEIHLTQDPTAHAELLAIRAASQQLGARLDGCVIYASGQPCPMCLSAMYLCGVERVVFAASNAMAEPFGLSTAAIGQQVGLPVSEQRLPIQHLPDAAMTALYREWKTLHAPE
ncbi:MULTISPECIES: nucleoside deaminase [Pseudomonas]|uniref:nucleoside deaminase n=1 Tax=Pseudomonas TaxID=286 RepID=UPI00098F6619|nr:MULTISPECIES: nucleoside deaminase [Pseudomonas]AQT91913.1 tRNA-specific adenosine deaminase [Pseudomonas azotoformans]PJK35417.1 nucleoside deaminase [Pseudomonas sp. S09F 262]PJK39357.1 nucleoside deaminase [Pseudomonas sp. S10E 269]UMY49682.1 nucleoside deaminase [Pseudomonas azotoformans]